MHFSTLVASIVVLALRGTPSNAPAQSRTLGLLATPESADLLQGSPGFGLPTVPQAAATDTGRTAAGTSLLDREIDVYFSMNGPAAPVAQPPVADVLANLRSTDWAIRGHAFRQIVDRSVVVPDNVLKAALTDLMQIEIPTMEAAYHGTTTLGEGYSEYVSVLQKRLMDMATPQDARIGQLLAQGAFNDDSLFVVKLAQFGESLVQTILEMSIHDVAPKRWNAYGLAGELVKQSREGQIALSSASVTQLKQLLRAGTTSNDYSDRLISVTHLGEAGDASDLPLLQKIATTDTMPGTGLVQFPIRDAALNAIRAITSR